MAMEINGSYGSAQTSYLERLKEEQPLDKTSRAEELKAGQEEKTPAQDEYISSEKSGAKPTGLYWIGEDENGNRKIFFDDPKKSGQLQITGLGTAITSIDFHCHTRTSIIFYWLSESSLPPLSHIGDKETPACLALWFSTLPGSE